MIEDQVTGCKKMQQSYNDNCYHKRRKYYFFQVSFSSQNRCKIGREKYVDILSVLPVGNGKNIIPLLMPG
ncbi:MAG: hypothetical protein GY797_16770 [Deltaproteobacteria bacterium]|nr:hypothetical protein [Deltaproteobacteria bacterium]